jgi:hypothetical protein
MRSSALVCFTVLWSMTDADAQGLDLRAGLPAHGVFPMRSFYTAVPVPEMLDTAGTQWRWDLMARSWEIGMESADTVWYHSTTTSPLQGGTFSAYELNEHRYSFFHVHADTLFEDSAWVITQGTSEIHYPSIPLCKASQQLGDTLRYFDRVAGVERMTTYRAHLSLRTAWMPWTELLVFEDRVLDFITYRIHRRDDLVREVARYVVGDGMYLVWPAE